MLGRRDSARSTKIPDIQDGGIHVSDGASREFRLQPTRRVAKVSRRFQRFRVASGLQSKQANIQVNTLIYAMGDWANDILQQFDLTPDQLKEYDRVVSKFESHFMKKWNVTIWTS